MSLRVFVVDEQPAVLGALARALGRQPAVSVRGTAGSAGEAFAELSGPVAVDVAVVGLPVDTAIELCRRLAEARPTVRCVLLSATGAAADAARARDAGAAGFLVKDLSPGALVSALRAAAGGRVVVDSRVARRLPHGLGLAALSPAEREVLRLLASGLSNAEIGRAVHAAPRAVAARVTRLLTKLGARTRAEAAHIALRAGAL